MPPTSSLKIAGFVPLSTVDKPGDLTATVFTRGCTWRCSYCHNPHLLDGEAADADETGSWNWERIMAFLDTRRGLLDGVAFSGGEPTIHAGLADAMREVRHAGFVAYLHTGGPLPTALGQVLPLLAWVGFDVKAPFNEYERVTGVEGSGAPARESLRLLIKSGVPFEVRTTVHSDQLDLPALERLADDLASEGIGAWVLQTCRTEGTRPGVRPSSSVLDHLGTLRSRVDVVTVR
jgi:pyruvate formate lyase activating enzyme